MSKIKKLIALTLALAMVLSVSAFAGYKVDTYADADKINEDCVDAVELLYALDIMVGDGKNFKPESVVTRAEMAKMIYVILNYGDDDKAVTYTGGKFFTDVPAGEWYEGYVNYCASTKLIAGRGDDKFDPTAPVTTAEAAKMLLTAIGYSAEARGYVGANWDKNVLSDAAIIGLLNGYKSNVNTYAPRQWVAVMIENMLLDAWTYFNMAPTFSGLLTSGETGEGVLPMGAKYYSLDSFSSVAYATEDALIDGDELASEDTVLFANELEIEGTGIKAADLGQKYKVIYNFDTMEAYSVRSLADVDTARVYDMEVDIKHATSGNAPSNKYVFTIGEIEATLAGGEVKYLTSNNFNGEIDVEDLYELIEGDVFSPNTLKAIDSEGDGDIDYFYITEYLYGYVVEVATSNKYGKYINVVAADTEIDEDSYEYLTFADEDDYNLYLKDTVITDDEIEEDNIVKMSYDIETGKYVIEVLPQAKGVEYEEYDDKNDIFVLDGKEYYIAEDEDDYDWSDTCEEFLLDEDYLGEELNIVYDGDLIVYVSEDDDSYDSMDKVNEQLVLLIDANDEYSNNTIREKEAIEYMTIDGKTHIAVYDVDEEDAVDFETVMEAAAIDNVADRLYKLKSGTKGRVYLEELDDENINEQLKVKKSVLNGFEEGDGYIVDATGSTVKVEIDDETYKVDADNKYFVGSWNSDDEFQATVMTLDELKHCIDEDAYAQILTYENAKGTRTTVVGGYLFLELTSDDASDYLYIEKIGRITPDGRKVDVVFSNGDKKSITVDEDESDELVKDVLYTYVYYFMDDEYVLERVMLGYQGAEIIDFDDDNYVWFDEADEHELDDETIAILTIEVDRDQTQVDDEDEEDVPAFELVVKGIEFVDLKDLKLEDIENDVDDKTYTQYTDFYLTAQDEDEVYEDLFYVVNFQIMDTCQDMEDELAEELANIFVAVLKGEKTFEIESEVN